MGEGIIFSANGNRTTEYLQAKNEIGHFSHIIYKNQLTMYCRPKLRVKSIKLLEGNIRLNLHDFGFGKGFLDLTPKAQATKNRQVGLYQN